MTAVEDLEDDERDREQGNRRGPRDRDGEEGERGADESRGMGVPEPPHDEGDYTGADEPTDGAGEQHQTENGLPRPHPVRDLREAGEQGPVDRAIDSKRRQRQARTAHVAQRAPRRGRHLLRSLLG